MTDAVLNYRRELHGHMTKSVERYRVVITLSIAKILFF